MVLRYTGMPFNNCNKSKEIFTHIGMTNEEKKEMERGIELSVYIVIFLIFCLGCLMHHVDSVNKEYNKLCGENIVKTEIIIAKDITITTNKGRIIKIKQEE